VSGWRGEGERTVSPVGAEQVRKLEVAGVGGCVQRRRLVVAKALVGARASIEQCLVRKSTNGISDMSPQR